MFVFYACLCGRAYKVSKTDADLHLLALRMRCPNESCTGDGLEIQDNNDAGGASSTAKDLFALSSGRGDAKERLCSPADLETLLLGGTISTMGLEPSSADPDRSIIDNMVVGFDLGTEKSRAVMVHFAMSVHGATIYKVTDL